MMEMKQKIADWLLSQTKIEEVRADMIETPPDSSLGDYALPCFKLSKMLRMPPQRIAAKLSGELTCPNFIEKIEAVSGYLNFYLQKGAYAKLVIDEMLDKKPAAANGRKIIIEYSSPNIAKPFHIGHLCSTVIGDSLSKIYSYLGYSVIRINHLGDYGTQFGKLISAYKRWGDENALQNDPISELFRIYVKFHAEAKEDPELEEEARAYFKNLEDGNPEETAIWQRFRELSLNKFSEIYKRLQVGFDSYAGESFYSDKMQAVVDELKNKNLLIKSSGAQVVDLSDRGLPPCLILKSDGASLYATRDIAAAIYRKKTYDFEKCIYVVGLPQTLHFQQFFTVLEKTGYEWSKNCLHVGFAHVRFKDGQMSTRNGKVVLLEDVLDESVKRAKAKIGESAFQPDDVDKAAEKVGIGAVRYTFLKAGREREILFDWDEVLDFNGDSGPYVQYTFARANSILNKAKSIDDEYRIISVCEPEWNLILHLNAFHPAVIEAAERNEPSVITRYVSELSHLYNRFYNACPVIGSENEAFRLKLTEAVSSTIKTALSLIGIECVDKM